MTYEMWCIVCRRHLRRDGGEAFHYPPINASVWVSYGNYGSTVWDPMGSGEKLECYICDPCLRVHAERVWYVGTDTPQAFDRYLRSEPCSG